ncbi:MAG: hypothetical protein R3C97_17070 [Geminicoccaceae bacterium]
MSDQPARAIRLFGTGEPVPERRELSAGSLSCVFEAGNLRHVRIGGREAIRAIQYIVRDDAWRTYNPVIDDLSIEEGEGRFRISYRGRCQDEAQGFAFAAEIEGHADGRLRFAATGRALSDFRTNRTGFTVLHPIIGVSGEPVEVEHTDGKIEKSRFPDEIDPLCPFQDIRALTHEVMPGVRVRCLMEGEIFEMEDQRNWTDASYKTYCRPLALPWPYTIAGGEEVVQSVTLEFTGSPAARSTRGENAITLVVGEASDVRVPPIGLGVLAEHAGSALARVDRLREAAPAHIMCRLDVRKGDGARDVARFGELAKGLGCEAVLEAVVPCTDAEGRPSADPAILRRDLERIAGFIEAGGSPFSRIVVSPGTDMKCTLPGSPWPPAPSWDELVGAAREILKVDEIGGGMFAFFTELNPQAAAAGPLRLRRTSSLSDLSRGRRSVDDGGAGVASVHVEDGAVLSWRCALLALSDDDRHARERLWRHPGGQSGQYPSGLQLAGSPRARAFRSGLSCRPGGGGAGAGRSRPADDRGCGRTFGAHLFTAAACPAMVR